MKMRIDKLTDARAIAWHMQVGILLALLLVSTQGCATRDYVSVRRIPSNPLEGPLQLLSRKGPQPTVRTKQLLRRYALEGERADELLAKLADEIAQEPLPEKLYAYAELAYVHGKRSEALQNKSRALDLYGAAVAHAYWYLFYPGLDRFRNPYDPQFRGACDLYNGALEAAMRIVNDRGQLQPGNTYRIDTGAHRFVIHIVPRGRWHADDFQRLEFVSDYDVQGLSNRHHTYGLGVPLIAVWQSHSQSDPAERYYPPGLSFPVTAFLRVLPPERNSSGEHSTAFQCVLELHDTVPVKDIEVEGRRVPLETDLTTPLAFFLDNPEFEQRKNIATWALLSPGDAEPLKGLYMLEPYEPDKIPVLMVHGLWSSPVTWMEMFNDLRSFPEIREQYQFWFYLYPTGQPFWVSARQLRNDLAEARRTLDPQRQALPLDHMVVVGHSMGGLVATLQTLESGNEFWSVLTDRSFDELRADEQTRQQLAETVFFHPNPSIERVVTIGTPHRGSEFANDYTRWLGRYLIRLPDFLVNMTQRLIRENPGFFRDTELLTVTTSIDSLSPDSPVLPRMLQARKAPWTHYHNIVGMTEESALIGTFISEGDGVVEFTSAHRDDVESEIVVAADHVSLHRHPRSILEVRRILLEHQVEAVAEMRQQAKAQLASYTAGRPVGPPLPAADRDQAIAITQAYLQYPAHADYRVTPRADGYWVFVRFFDPQAPPDSEPAVLGRCTVVVSPSGEILRFLPGY